jgi:hypothetical protein
MDAVLWLMLPLLTSAGSALLSFFIMQARMEVAIAKEREALAEAKAAIANNERHLEARVKAAEEEARRRAVDEFLQDFRVEERHYMRENKSLFMRKRSMVLQERLYFRSIPLSNWVEHEMLVEEGGDVQALARASSVFSNHALGPGLAEADEGIPPGPAAAMAAAASSITRLLR